MPFGLTSRFWNIVKKIMSKDEFEEKLVETNFAFWTDMATPGLPLLLAYNWILDTQLPMQIINKF